MPEFLELIETYRASEASADRLYAGEGRSSARRRTSTDPRYIAQLTEAARLMDDVASGRRPMAALSEAMTTSDFPYLFGDILDRQLLASYLETPSVWPAFARRSTVRDFRTVKRVAVDGAEGVLSTVAEKAPYPAAALTDTQDSYAVVKRGRRLHFSWEDYVNDDLGGLESAPQRLARAARRSEDYFATSLFVDASGPHASLYTAPFANIVTGNPALTVAGLQAAFTKLASQTDADGMPIMIDAVNLVVPPALEVTATNILNATEILIAAGSTSGTADRLKVENWMKNKVNLVVDYFIPLIATTANGATSWFLFANPTSGRPALEMGFLRGHESPELFMKASDAVAIGGGGADDMDFDTDSKQYKVRHVFGGTQLLTTGGPKATVASNGSGS